MSIIASPAFIEGMYSLSLIKSVAFHYSCSQQWPRCPGRYSKYHVHAAAMPKSTPFPYSENTTAAGSQYAPRLLSFR